MSKTEFGGQGEDLAIRMKREQDLCSTYRLHGEGCGYWAITCSWMNSQSPASPRITQVGRRLVIVPVRSGGRVGVQLSLVLEQKGISSPQAHGHYLHVRVVVQQLMLLCGEAWIGAAEISTSALLRA